MATVEQTLVIVKPDGVQRGLSGEIIARLERRGLKIVALKFARVSEEQAARHYAEHEGKGFYPSLIAFITSGPSVLMVLEGPRAIDITRHAMGGATDPLTAGQGSIRGDFGLEIGRNLVHGSANAADATREIPNFFAPDELVAYERALDRWIAE